MILPVVAYGDPILRKKCEEIDKDYPKLEKLIDNMFETMYEANGVGLAAPQIGKSIRLFIADATPFAEAQEDDDEIDKGCIDFVRVFINPIIYEETGEEWGFEEGCLSIPNIREEVIREPKIKIEYYNRKFELVEEELDGFAARVVQHEYDHIEGILFTDHINAMRRTLLKGKLKDISKGKVNVNYRMKFPKKVLK